MNNQLMNAAADLAEDLILKAIENADIFDIERAYIGNRMMDFIGSQESTESSNLRTDLDLCNKMSLLVYGKPTRIGLNTAMIYACEALRDHKEITL
jgi:hypothetical protein